MSDFPKETAATHAGHVEFADQIHRSSPMRIRTISKGEWVCCAQQVCAAPAGGTAISADKDEPDPVQHAARVFYARYEKSAKLLRAGRCDVSPVLSVSPQRRNIPSAKRDGHGNGGIPREAATEPA